MKKILVLFIVSTLILGFSMSVSAGKLVPLHIANYEIAETLNGEDLFPIYREIDGKTPISNTIKALINLELTKEEKNNGFSTEWTKDHSVSLRGVSLGEGELIIELRDPFRFTSGGSARVRSLKNQIKKTVLQFGFVDQVKFIGPDWLFQP
ncbi:MAG: GerMN domain-containing protein [Patescibacteria group bacterium]